MFVKEQEVNGIFGKLDMMHTLAEDLERDVTGEAGIAAQTHAYLLRELLESVLDAMKPWEGKSFMECRVCCEVTALPRENA